MRHSGSASIPPGICAIASARKNAETIRPACEWLSARSCRISGSATLMTNRSMSSTVQAAKSRITVIRVFGSTTFLFRSESTVTPDLQVASTLKSCEFESVRAAIFGARPPQMQDSGHRALSERELEVVTALQRDPRASWATVGELIGTNATTASRIWQQLDRSGACVDERLPRELCQRHRVPLGLRGAWPPRASCYGPRAAHRNLLDGAP